MAIKEMNAAMTLNQTSTLDKRSNCDVRLTINNFDVLRFTFAFIVFLVHAYALSGAESLLILNKLFSSAIAVKSFFVVSGFLIFMSSENAVDNKRYFLKRARRIYSAYQFT